MELIAVVEIVKTKIPYYCMQLEALNLPPR